jgi:hypothetical protein
VPDDRRRKLVACKRNRCHPLFYRLLRNAPLSRDEAPAGAARTTATTRTAPVINRYRNVIR